MDELKRASKAPLRILAQLLPNGCWSARFEQHTEIAFEDRVPTVAAMRLVRAVPGLAEESLRIVWLSRRGSRIDFAVSPAGQVQQCPECRGTGRYVGLLIVEDCTACGGSGKH